jgi:hypothetical protein
VFALRTVYAYLLALTSTPFVGHIARQGARTW